MATTTAVLGFLLTVAVVGISGDIMTVAPDVTVNFTCSGPVSVIQPTWFLNGTFVESDGNCYRSRLRRLGELNGTAILTISGSYDTCDNFKIYCRIFRDSQFLYLHNTTLTVQGQLPSPENAFINESVNSQFIEWKPPYSSLNSDTIQVDPHITQYTVYITDIYTGNIFKRNVTETRFTFNASDDGTCPMYQVTGWNAGGEGELSEPVHECRPHIPRKIAGQNVTLIVGSQVLHIYLHVSEPCKMRTPNYFLITVIMNSGRTINTTTVEYDHQPRFHNIIDLPQNADMCSLHVNISAVNSAGMSPPTKIKVECSTSVNSSNSIPTTSTKAETTPPVVIDEAQGEDNTQTIVIIIGVIAVIGGVSIVAATVGILYCRGHRRGEVKNREIEMKPNQAYETVTRAQPATQVHTEPCPAYEVVLQAHH